MVPGAAKRIRSQISDFSLGSDHSSQDLMVIEGVSVYTQTATNPLLEKVSRLKREAPMTYSNVWKLYENLQAEKYKLDRLEMALGRTPRAMNEFMMDFMYMNYGLKSLALKQLKALVTSLEQLNKVGHTYGVLFCRSLGLFHPRPMPNHVSTYINIVQEQFNLISKRLKKESFAQHYEILQYGGEADLVDAMELVMKLCHGSRDAGERIIQHFQPEMENRVSLILLKICGTMSRMGKDQEYMFELLDLDHGGSIDYHEFVDGIRYALNIWVSQEEAEDLASYIDESGTGQISHEEWTAKVNFEEYKALSQSGEVTVTKAEFLTAFIDEYETEVLNDYYSLRKKIRTAMLSQENMANMLQQIDPHIEEHEIMRIYEEALGNEKDPSKGVSPESFCIVVLKHRVGGYGVGIFDIMQLEAQLPRQSEQHSHRESSNV